MMPEIKGRRVCSRSFTEASSSAGKFDGKRYPREDDDELGGCRVMGISHCISHFERLSSHDDEKDERRSLVLCMKLELFSASMNSVSASFSIHDLLSHLSD